MAEITPEAREEIQVCAYKLTEKLSRAMSRCRDIAKSELVMDYTESAAGYTEVANEIASVRIWMNEQFNDLLYSESHDADSCPGTPA